MMIPAAIGACVTPLYLFSDSYPMVAGAFILQGAFLGAIYGRNPAYLTERFPTEVRATASGSLLSSRSDLGRLHRAGAHLLRRRSATWLRRSDAGGDDQRRDDVRHHAAV